MAATPSAGSAANPEVVIRVAGLSKVFKDFWGRPKARAVDNVDFEVRRGEVFGLLGPNGSGKSTTVKMLLGLLYPTKGHIEVFGHSPRHVQTKSRIGYLPEESYLYRYLDSEETLEFFGNLFSLDSKDRRQRAEQLLSMVGLDNARRAMRKLVSAPLPREGTLTFVDTPEAAATGVDFVQESAPERLELKQQLLRRASANIVR